MDEPKLIIRIGNIEVFSRNASFYWQEDGGTSSFGPFTSLYTAMDNYRYVKLRRLDINPNPSPRYDHPNRYDNVVYMDFAGKKRLSHI